MNEIKNIDFHDKVLNDFYHEFPIQINLSELSFYYDDEDERWKIDMCISTIHNSFMKTIYTPEEDMLDDKLIDLIYEFEEDYMEVTYDQVMNTDNPEEFIYNADFMEELRKIMERYIDKELDRRIDKIREIYYQVYYLARCTN